MERVNGDDRIDGPIGFFPWNVDGSDVKWTTMCASCGGVGAEIGFCNAFVCDVHDGASCHLHIGAKIGIESGS